MKKVFIVSIFSIFLANCTTDDLSNATTTSSQTISSTSDVKPIINNTDLSAKSIKTSTEISLSTVTRGFYSSTNIKGRKLTRNSSGVVPPSTIQISTTKMNILKQKFAALNLAKIPSYNAPTCLRCGDRDLGQTLEIKYDGVTYTSKVYDATNPPAALKDFIFYINSLK